jgi:hypothetical protein
MASSGLLRSAALIRTDVSEELSASIIRVSRICEIGTLAVTSYRRMLRRITKSCFWLADFCHPHDGGDAFLRNVGS